MPPIVTLLTDFGVDSTYPAQMKGVILQRCPEAVVVDLTHGVPRHDVRSGAFMLASAYGAFPKGTVHVAVVDPGVGSARRIVAAETEDAFFVAPDNGLLTVVLRSRFEEEPETETRLVAVENTDLMRPEVSSTFHGRDIFAPVGGELARGAPLEELGPELDVFRPLDLPSPRIGEEVIEGAALYIDPFGNIVTNIPAQALPTARPDALKVQILGAVINGLADAYADVPPGMLLAYIGSAGLLEVAVNQQSAAKRLGADIGAPVRVELGDE